jgi:hypothetical protein
MTAIYITEVTAGSLEGTGAFDKIMSAMQIRLEEEFSQGRITGDDYANVYLGAMTASMQQAVAFVLGKQTADSQAELTKAQALEVNAQTALVTQQKVNLVSENTNIGKQGLQLDAQVALVGQQRTNLAAEVANIAIQGSLLTAQKDQSTAQAILIGQQKANLLSENANIGKQGSQIDAQAALANRQVANLLTENGNITLQGTLLTAQSNQANAQTALLGKKGLTEDAQLGVIAKQNLLYQAQTDGFARDAEQKLVKIIVDTWNVRRTTDSATNPANTGLTDTDIKTVLTAARKSVGI